MNISLGGSPGRGTAGCATMAAAGSGGRAVEPSRRTRKAGPAAGGDDAAEMALPDRRRRRGRHRSRPPRQRSDRARPPAAGSSRRLGTAKVETGARGQGFGLSTGAAAARRREARRGRLLLPGIPRRDAGPLIHRTGIRTRRAAGIVTDAVHDPAERTLITDIEVGRVQRKPVLDLAAQRAWSTTRTFRRCRPGYPVAAACALEVRVHTDKGHR